MNSFNEAPRDDLNMMEFMLQNGWSTNFSVQDFHNKRTTPESCPQDPVGYQKDDIYLRKQYKYVPNEKNPQINDVVGYWRLLRLDHHKFTELAKADNLKDLL